MKSKLLLATCYAEALADWHNTRSPEARQTADHYLAEWRDQYGNADMGVKVVQIWVADTSEAEARQMAEHKGKEI